MRKNRTLNVQTSIIRKRTLLGRRKENEKSLMGILREVRDTWADKRFLIQSPSEQQRILNAKQCTQEGVRAGAKAASIACVASAVPTLIAVRVFPWAKSNLNYTAQALIISAASIAAYFITADKTILECARRNSGYHRTT